MDQHLPAAAVAESAAAPARGSAKDILDELTGVQGRVHKIEMMIIKLKNESKETIKPC